MGTAGRSAPLRRAGSLLGLLGLELAAVLALHWLGRFPGLRIGWSEPVPWLLSSPVQDVLGALLRTVGLVMAYWLLVSTVLYLLASLTRLPSAVRAVGWATLPLARRVADHAVAVTLVSSMVGGTTLGVAGPALAAERARLGPPARLPVAAAQAAPPSSGSETTESSGYTPEPADQVPSSSGEATTAPTRATTAPTEPKPTQTSGTGYTPNPADRVPSTSAAASSSSTTATTEPPTTTTAKPSTTTEATPTTSAPTTATTAPPTTTTTTTEPSSGGPSSSGGQPGSGGGGTTKGEEAVPHTVAPGENLWTIARDHLEKAAAGGSGEPTTDEVTAYWDQVKAANQPRLESHDPDVIKVGEQLVLPPVPTAGAGPAPETRKGTRQPVDPGDSLWTIARDHLIAVGKGSGEPSNRQVTEYWAKVKAANRDRLKSGDPDIIEPGEVIVLPPVD